MNSPEAAPFVGRKRISQPLPYGSLLTASGSAANHETTARVEQPGAGDRAAARARGPVGHHLQPARARCTQHRVTTRRRLALRVVRRDHRTPRRPQRRRARTTILARRRQRGRDPRRERRTIDTAGTGRR